jgi:hypothetical protein
MDDRDREYMRRLKAAKACRQLDADTLVFMLKRAQQLARRPGFDYDDWLVIIEHTAAVVAVNAAKRAQQALGSRAQGLRAALAERDDQASAPQNEPDDDLPPAA